jgi:hypothetical protein
MQDPKRSIVTYGLYSYPSRFLVDTSFYYRTLPKTYCNSLKEKRKTTWHNIEYEGPILCSYSHILNDKYNKFNIAFFDPCFSDLTYWSNDSHIYSVSLNDCENLVLKAVTTLDDFGRLNEFKFFITEQSFVRMTFSYDEDNNMTGLILYDETGALKIEVTASYKNGSIKYYCIKEGSFLKRWFMDDNGISHIRYDSLDYSPEARDFIIKKTKDGVVELTYDYYNSDYIYARAKYYDKDGKFLYGEKWNSDKRSTFTDEHGG